MPKDQTATLWDRLNAKHAFFLIAGPCVIESEQTCQDVAFTLKDACGRLGMSYVFKASFDKANRSSLQSYRGPGLEAGLSLLAEIRTRCGVPVLTDIHSPEQAAAAAKKVDIIQIPALLCRQTDLVLAAAKTQRIVNLKKGPFLSPADMKHVVKKVEAAGNTRVMLTERGSTFGYHNLVADMRSIPIMQRNGYPVVFDATHSVQLPGSGGEISGGESEFAPILARSAVAAGADGLFLETHPDPSQALSDGPNMIPLDEVEPLLRLLIALRQAIALSLTKGNP